MQRWPPESFFQTKSTIQSLLLSVGTAPRKRFGQCFLIDRNLMNKLVDSAELTQTDTALEVGCGTGSLTSLLASRCARVVAVEVDSVVAGLAREQLSDFDNVVVLETDALARKSEIAPAVLEAACNAQREAGGALKLVANLPYDIATPLVVDLLLCELPIASLCFTVQTEVADRFLAAHSTGDYGPVSVLTQLLTEASRVCKLPPQAFWPAPKVHSTMVRLVPRPRDEWLHANLKAFSEFVHGFFRFRRKTIGHISRMLSLPAGLHAALAEIGVDPSARPENLAPAQWLACFRACQ